MARAARIGRAGRSSSAPCSASSPWSQRRWVAGLLGAPDRRLLRHRAHRARRRTRSPMPAFRSSPSTTRPPATSRERPRSRRRETSRSSAMARSGSSARTQGRSTGSTRSSARSCNRSPIPVVEASGFNFDDDSIWVTDLAGPHVIRIDKRTGVVADFPFGTDELDQAVASDVAVGAGSVWLARPDVPEITRLDAETGKVQVRRPSMRGA